MSTILLNPMFKSIRGRMGNVVHYKRNGVQCLRTYVIPRNPDTPAQRKIRGFFSEAMKEWQALSSVEKKTYYLRAKRNRDGKKAHNLFISEYIIKKKADSGSPSTLSIEEIILLPGSPLRCIRPSAPVNELYCRLSSDLPLIYVSG